jgi:hypothetical protein
MFPRIFAVFTKFQAFLRPFLHNGHHGGRLFTAISVCFRYRSRRLRATALQNVEKSSLCGQPFFIDLVDMDKYVAHLIGIRCDQITGCNVLPDCGDESGGTLRDSWIYLSSPAYQLYQPE